MSGPSKPASRFGWEIHLMVDDEHTYVVPSPDARVGMYLTDMASVMSKAALYLNRGEDPPEALEQQAKALQPPKGYAENPYRAVLGEGVYDQVLEDGFPFEVLKLMTATVGVWVTESIEDAYDYWNNGGRKPNPTRAERRARKTTSRSRAT